MYLHRHSFKQNEIVLYRVFYPFPNVIPEQAFVPEVARVTTAGSDRIRLSSPGGSPDCGVGTPVLSKIIEDLKELGFYQSIFTLLVKGERFMRSKGKAKYSITN